MKINFTKSLLTLMAVAFAISLFGQSGQDTIYIWGGPNSTGSEYDNSTFNGGMNDWTTEGIECKVPDSVHNAIWTWSDVDTLKGAYFGVRKIVTPTRANGYVAFDSDFLDNDGIAGNFSHGLAPAPQISGLTSPALDFTGEDSVAILFAENYRNFDSRTVLQVSNDGGSTWTDFSIAYNDDIATNDGIFSEIHQITLDITSVAANQADVRVRFLWTYPENGDGYYFWAVDDVAFIKPLAPDLAIKKIFVPAGAYMQPKLTGVECDTMEFTMVVSSLTYTVGHDVPVKVEVSNSAGDVLFSTQAILDAVPGDGGDTITFDEKWAPINVVDTYTVTYSFAYDSDTDTTNNVMQGQFVVSENTFDSGPSLWGYPYTRIEKLFAEGVRYFTCDFGSLEVEIKKISFSVSSIGEQSLDGETVSLYVEKVIDDNNWKPGQGELTLTFDEKNNNNTWEFKGVSFYELSDALNETTLEVEKLTNTLGDTIPNVILEPNSNYVFALLADPYMNGAPTNADLKGIAFGNSTEVDNFGTEFLIIDNITYDKWNNIGGAAIKVEVGLVVDSKEPKLADNALSIIENPTKDELRLNIALDRPTDIGYGIASMNGSILQMGSWKNVQDAQKTLDISNLPNGQYLVRIQTEEGIATKMFVVAR